MGARHERREAVLFSPSLLLTLLSECVLPCGPLSPKDLSEQDGLGFVGAMPYRILETVFKNL